MLYDIIASVKNKRILNRKKHVYEKNLLNDNRAVRKYNMEVAVLKKLVTVLGAFFAVLLACPLSVFAAEGSKAPSTVPVWLCIPFAGLLLCIAVMPLVKAEWWESHQPLVVALWIILMDAVSILMSFMIMFFANACGINVSISMMIIILLANVLLSVGTPGIPGGAIASFAALATMAGLPAGVMGVYISINTLCDMGATCVNVIGDMAGCVVLKKKIKLED